VIEDLTKIEKNMFTLSGHVERMDERRSVAIKINKYSKHLQSRLSSPK
jgi:hypothetical protein